MATISPPALRASRRASARPSPAAVVATAAAFLARRARRSRPLVVRDARPVVVDADRGERAVAGQRDVDRRAAVAARRCRASGWIMRSTSSSSTATRTGSGGSVSRTSTSAPSSRALPTATDRVAGIAGRHARGRPPGAPPRRASRPCASSGRRCAGSPRARRGTPAASARGAASAPSRRSARERGAQLVRELGGEALLVPEARRDPLEQAVERRGEPRQLVVGLAEVEAPVEVVLAPAAAFAVIRDTGRSARPSIQRESSATAPSSRSGEDQRPDQRGAPVSSYGSSETAETTVP